MPLRSLRNCLKSRFAAVVLVALTACDSTPTSTTPPSGAKNQLSPAAGASGPAAAPVPSRSDTLVAAEPTPSGDVPALHEPFVATKTVAPGLQLIISSVPVAASAIIREPSDLSLVLTIKHGQQVIFRDTARDGLTYTEYSEPATAKLYPIWLPTGPGAGELLVAYNNRPSRDKTRRFFIRGNQVVKIDTLPTFNGPAKDPDRNGKLEYAGLSDYGEEWGGEGQPHYTAYNPTLYYEIRPTGLAFDSALTKRKALAQYDIFYGYEYSTKPGVLLK